MWLHSPLSKIHNKHFLNHFTTEIHFLKIFQKFGTYIYRAWYYVYFYKAVFLMYKLQRAILSSLIVPSTDICDF